MTAHAPPAEALRKHHHPAAPCNSPYQHHHTLCEAMGGAAAALNMNKAHTMPLVRSERPKPKGGLPQPVRVGGGGGMLSSSPRC